ncbi:hypothetical protein [Corynebacterium sp. A21]|uniref:hypothetical protein n=1 Tax=Corynebacterium sp. A21 TaxID=3457318 RepID=UPI003FD45F11
MTNPQDYAQQDPRGKQARYEAERKRRMADLRRRSAQKTLEVIERKFPNLKKDGTQEA